MRNQHFNSIVVVASLLIAVVSMANHGHAQATRSTSNPPQSAEKKSGSPTELESEIEAAKKFAAEQRKIFAESQRLAESGSVSRIELRRSNYEYKLAMLQVIELENPETAKEIALVRAQLELDLTTKELEIVANLFQRGAASELEYQRARSAFDVAKFSHQAIQNGQGEKLLQIKAAQAKHKLATEIFRKADRLIKSSSISQTVFEQAKASLQNAEDELELAKKELGISVRQVPVPAGANR